MKKLYTILLLNLLVCSLALGQMIPRGMKYQAVARDLTGAVMANQEIALKINLTSPQTKGGQVHYSETHTVTTNQFGLFTLTVGEGKVGNGGFASIPWSSEDIWMEIAIRDKGKSNFATLSSSKLLAVPYAMHAATASELVGTNSNPQARAAAPSPGVPSQNWSLFGNSKSDETKDKLGTTDYMGLIFVTNNIERMKITADGDIFMKNNLTVGKDLTVQKNVYLNTMGGETINNGPFTVDKQSPTVLTGTLRVDGIATVTNTTESTDKTNGALIVAGGTGIGKNLNVGGNTDLDGTLNVDGATTLNNTLNVVGNTTIQGITNVTNTTESTDKTNGAFIVAGGAGIGKNLNVGGNGDVDGSLNVDGATTLKSTLTVTGPTIINSTVGLNGQVTIDADVNGLDDSYDSYPLRVQGSNQGIAIKVDGSRDNSTNFVTFMDGTKIWGTIEGETYAELTTTGEFIATNALFVADGVTIAAEGVACGFQLDLGEVAVMVAQALVIVAQAIVYNTMVLNDVGVAFTSGSGDYAEWLEKSTAGEAFSYGDIVGVRGGKITKNTEKADHFMVISLSPIVLGNMPKKGEEKNYRKVAFMGQVPVKVTGKVAIGDYIIPRGDNQGFGIAVNPARMTLEQYRQIVGVAWTASKANTNFSMINVAVGINSNDLVAKLIKQQAELDEMKGKMNGIVGYLKSKDANFKEELYAVPTSAPAAPASAVAVNASPAPVYTPSVQSVTSLKENFVYSDFSELFEKKPQVFEESMATVKKNFINQGADLSKNPELSRLLNDKEFLKSTIKRMYDTKK